MTVTLLAALVVVLAYLLLRLTSRVESLERSRADMVAAHQAALALSRQLSATDLAIARERGW